MAGDKRSFDEDDIASLYLRRMRGEDKSAEAPAAPPAETRARPAAPPPPPRPADDLPFDSGPAEAPVLDAPRPVAPPRPSSPFDEDADDAPLPKQFGGPGVAPAPPASRIPGFPGQPPKATDDTASPPASRIPGFPGQPQKPPDGDGGPRAPRFPGAPPPVDGGEADAPASPPRTMPPARRPPPPDDAEALPLGAPVVHQVDTDVQPKIAPGALPIWMASEGLNMLRQGDYSGAAEYYEEEAKRDPDRAEGWLGIGAALVGSGDFRKAVTYLLKGVEFDKTFPVGALLSEAKPGHPQMLLNMAELFLAVNTPIAVQVAINVLDECMSTPTTPQGTYMKANELRRKSRELLGNMQLADKTKLLAIQDQARRAKTASSVMRTLITLIVLAALGVGGWFGYRFAQSYRLTKQGMIDYGEAWHIASVGSGTLNSSKNVSDAIELYYKSFTEFRDASEYGAKDFQAWFMILRSGEAIMERARSSSAVQKKLSPGALGEVEKWIKLARVNLAKLDPSGSMLKERQAELTQSLQQK